MEITQSKAGKAVVLAVTGRMDAGTSIEFEKRCAELLAADEKWLVADFSNLEFISSAGLRSILAVGKKLKAAQGGMVFCGLKGLVKEVFEISGFNSIFQAYDNAKTAADKL